MFLVILYSCLRNEFEWYFRPAKDKEIEMLIIANIEKYENV